MSFVKVSVCCGDKKFEEGWTYLDIVDHGFNDVITDLRQLPFADDSVDVLYSSHTLEYYNREDGFEVLKEFKRVLKKGGELWLSVPDFKALASVYLEDELPLHRLVGPLYGQMDVGGKIVYHKTVYDYHSLGEMLRIVGFRKVHKWFSFEFERRLNKDHRYDDCSKADIEDRGISLNVNCVKV